MGGVGEGWVPLGIESCAPGSLVLGRGPCLPFALQTRSSLLLPAASPCFSPLFPITDLPIPLLTSSLPS